MSDETNPSDDHQDDDEREDAKLAGSSSLLDDLEELDDDETWMEDDQDDNDNEDQDQDQEQDIGQDGLTDAQRRLVRKVGSKDRKKQQPYPKALWDAIQVEYEAGHLTIEAIAQKYGGPTRAAISARARRYKWQRNLVGDVARARNSAIIMEDAGFHGEDADGALASEQGPAPEDIVKRAARSQVDVVRSHRADIRRLRAIANDLATLLERIISGDEAGKEIDTKVGPKIVYPFMGAYETVSDLLMKLVQAQSKLIPLERQAFGLDKDETPGADRSGLEHRVRSYMAKTEEKPKRDRRDEDRRRAASKANLQDRAPSLVRMAANEKNGG